MPPQCLELVVQGRQKMISECPLPQAFDNCRKSEKNNSITAAQKECTPTVAKTATHAISSSSSSSSSSSEQQQQHRYHDYYSAPIFEGTDCQINFDENEARITNTSSKNNNDHSSLLSIKQQQQQQREERGYRVFEPFPVKLHNMLSQAECEGFSDVVTWQPHGRCFVILQSQKFAEEILPKYFKQIKISSFQRQINLYGFCRLGKGRDSGGYYHELFLRGRPDLCKRMSRRPIKRSRDTNRSAAAAAAPATPPPGTQPNFYTMEHCLEKTKTTQTRQRKSKEDAAVFSLSGKEDAPLTSLEEERKISTPGDRNNIKAQATGTTIPRTAAFEQHRHQIMKPEDNNNNINDETKQPNSAIALSLMASSIASPGKNHLLRGPPPSSLCSSYVGTEILSPSSRRGDHHHHHQQHHPPPRHHELRIPSAQSAFIQATSSSSSSSTATTGSSKRPRSGEELFFEGRPFRYLDSIILSDLKKLMT